MINNKIDLTGILTNHNFTVGKVPNANSYRNQSFCFQLTEYFGSGVVNKRTNLFVFTLDDEFLEDILKKLSENEINVNVTFTGIKDAYLTYEINLSKSLGGSFDW